MTRIERTRTETITIGIRADGTMQIEKMQIERMQIERMIRMLPGRIRIEMQIGAMTVPTIKTVTAIKIVIKIVTEIATTTAAVEAALITT
jgi:hypothetical protein